MAKKVLIIEDDKFLRDLMAQKLVAEGYDVIEAMDGEKGLESAKQEKPDLILLDLILPGIDGFEILANVKADQNISQIPVVILSNLGQAGDVDRSLRLGAKSYMIKAHFTPAEIIAKVKEIIG